MVAAKDPHLRRLVASKAANTRWAFEDPTVQSERARAAIEARFAQLVDPDGKLEPAERARRAARAKKAHYQGLALKSVQARRKIPKDAA